jgi:hypothetical protein
MPWAPVRAIRVGTVPKNLRLRILNVVASMSTESNSFYKITPLHCTPATRQPKM